MLYSILLLLCNFYGFCARTTSMNTTSSHLTGHITESHEHVVYSVRSAPTPADDDPGANTAAVSTPCQAAATPARPSSPAPQPARTPAPAPASGPAPCTPPTPTAHSPAEMMQSTADPRE